MLITHVSFHLTFKLYFRFAKEMTEFELNYKLTKGNFIFILFFIVFVDITQLFLTIILYFIKKSGDKGDISRLALLENVSLLISFLPKFHLYQFVHPLLHLPPNRCNKLGSVNKLSAWHSFCRTHWRRKHIKHSECCRLGGFVNSLYWQTRLDWIRCI